MTDLRAGVNAHNPGQGWTDNPLTTSIPIKAVHYAELRTAIQSLWTGGNMGTIPDWSSGGSPRSETPIYLADLNDLRRWLNAYQIRQSLPERVWAYATGTVAVVNTHYDPMGRKLWETAPRHQAPTVLGKFNRADWDLTTNARTQYEYDALGRGTKVTPPGGEYSRVEYIGAEGTVTTRSIDPLGHVREQVADSFGRVLLVREYSGAYPSQQFYASAAYKYNGRDQLIEVTDAYLNKIVIEYDLLRRKRKLHDPDLCGTNTLGMPGYWWTYDYDPNGNLITQVDAKAQTLSFEYDQFNRLRFKRSGANTWPNSCTTRISGLVTTRRAGARR